MTRFQLFKKLSQIHFVNLNPTAGREQSGIRPVLALSIHDINRLPLVVTVVVGMILSG
jgi:mRNA interferase MazF